MPPDPLLFNPITGRAANVDIAASQSFSAAGSFVRSSSKSGILTLERPFVQTAASRFSSSRSMATTVTAVPSTKTSNGVST